MKLYSEVIFPKCFDWVLAHQGFEPIRRQVLENVRGRILEIGIGTGLNLDFYPSWVKKITAVEPNPGMREQLSEKSANHSVHVSCYPGVAENLPFDNQSFDSVVSTFTLCSMDDVNQGLMEIRRVLAPGGRFIFMDHGLSKDQGVAITQRVLNPIQNIIGCGCRLTVDVGRELLRAGFKTESIQVRYEGTGPKFLGNVYRGVAYPV